MLPSSNSRITGQLKTGRATAPPSVCYSFQLGSAIKGYTHTTASSTNSQEQNTAAVSQSVLDNFNNCIHQKSQSFPSYTSDCNLYSHNTSAASIPQSSSHCSNDYFTSNHTSINNFSSFISSNNNNNIDSDNNFEFSTTPENSPKNQEDLYLTPDTFSFQSCDQPSPTSFSCLKITKPNSVSSGKHTASYSNPLTANTQSKFCQNKELIDFDKNSNLKKNSGGTHKSLKTFKYENFEELQPFFSRSGTKIKNSQETSQDLVTDSLLHFLYKKNLQDTSTYDLGDLNSILISLSTKYKSEEISGLKKKESIEDFKLMNDFLAKLLLEKEEKRFKSLDEKKKVLHKDFDDLSNELDERKIKRDAMSHYQEDKNHQKRSSNYGDFNQWEYFTQQDIQSPNNHSRRGTFPFGGSSQQHSVGWNSMGIGMPRQANPYYSNPHSHMMPAHAHSEYRYNQWNNPNHKNIPNVHNAHSQSTILPQGKMDIKHHSDISSADFGLPIGSTSEFSKYRPTSRGLMQRAPTNLSDKSTRAGIHPDHLLPTAIRNCSSIRAPPISSHPKTVINNPLSDLQMLVTNQENDKDLPQKADNFQQESVDLSAHSDLSKQKENLEEKSLNSSKKDIRSPVSVIQTQKPVKSDLKDSEKPVELTSKCDKNTKTPDPCQNDSKNKTNNGSVVENVKKCEEPMKTSVIVGKDGNLKKVLEETKGEEKEKKEENEDKEKQAGNEEKEKKEENEEKEKKAGNEEKEKNEGNEEKEKNEGNEEKEKKGGNEEKEEKEILKPEGKKEEEKIVNEENVSETDNPQTTSEIPKEEPSKSNPEITNESQENLESSRKCKRKAEEQDSREKKKVFLEVESRLEGENSDLPTVTSTTPASTETKPTGNETTKKIPKKKPSRKSRIGRLSSGQSSGSERSFPSRKSKSKEDSKKKVKKNLSDVMERRGPFLHVEGSRESPASVILVNFPKGDDEDEKEKNLVKKQILNSSRTKHHNELDYKGRSRNGLYSSTLSARYDAHTTDYSWVCVFCKKGPHYNTMGDLFGPYIISKDENTSLGDFSGDEKDISDAQKRGGRNKKSIRSNNMVEHFQKMSKKLRRTQSIESCLTGMTVISDEQVDKLRYEVWMHELCAVWSPNVFLIGSRIVGMQEAIWCSVKTVCSKCGIYGANLGCVYRNCPNRSHYHCAKESGWSLKQENFISTCQIHKPRS